MQPRDFALMVIAAQVRYEREVRRTDHIGWLLRKLTHTVLWALKKKGSSLPSAPERWYPLQSELIDRSRGKGNKKKKPQMTQGRLKEIAKQQSN